MGERCVCVCVNIGELGGDGECGERGGGRAKVIVRRVMVMILRFLPKLLG